jgi:hypothetical protein
MLKKNMWFYELRVIRFSQISIAGIKIELETQFKLIFVPNLNSKTWINPQFKYFWSGFKVPPPTRTKQLLQGPNSFKKGVWTAWLLKDFFLMLLKYDGMKNRTNSFP